MADQKNNDISIQSQAGVYSVHFLENISELLASIASRKKKALAVVDSQVASLYPTLIQALMQKVPVLNLLATEENKTLDGLTFVLKAMQENGLDKQSEILVVGGGIVQDICALAANLYYRGIPYILIPTTLLSMADSCIGAKSSLNFNNFKNQLGSFYAPKEVYVCVDFVQTLSKLEVLSGYGEIFKLFLINDRLSEFTTAREKLDHLIYIALMIKKPFIEEDEFDIGVRRILNYGHTFGHAIELITQYKVPHGLAVILGIDIVNHISVELGFLSREKFESIRSVIMALAPWESFSLKFESRTLVEAIKKDKKVESSAINLVLLTTTGKMILEKMPIGLGLEQILNRYTFWALSEV